jgi:hypothetical protein
MPSIFTDAVTLYQVVQGRVHEAVTAPELYFTITTPDGGISLHPLRHAIDAEIERVRQGIIATYQQQQQEEQKDELALLLVDDPQPKTD